jgi:hypothetical protein
LLILNCQRFWILLPWQNASSYENIRSDPASPDALAWKGSALADQAIAGPPAHRADMLASARKTIGRTIVLDPQAPVPLIAYFESFTKAGETVPPPAMMGMAEVIRASPSPPRRASIWRKNRSVRASRILPEACC